ncbi:protein kinase domain-containing protein [Sorangium sp. So ce131]|uniref:serine/threonine-protein kinase n=1 Tax=Sorangium sp. So ce131 TaxID=3133282 RepID=UPI003F5F16E8
MVGTTLARKYRILRLLGKGGMGAVYEAQHTGTFRRVAVKVIREHLIASRGGGAHRFRREARAAGAIESEHIVRILDSGDDELSGMLYLVMELLEGDDLQRLIRHVGPLEAEAALRIAAQALRGLARAHEAQVVHRDIKPANIFLARGEDGEITVKLLDFGIAKIKADALDMPHTTGLTGTGSFLGSPLYMSPEQVENSRDVDFRSDLWSLGSALYCALSGQAPHESAGSLSKLFVSICTSPVPPLHEVAPWVPREVAEVVHGALQIRPEDRYPSATAMLEALRPLLPDGLALRQDMLVPARGAPPARAAPSPWDEDLAWSDAPEATATATASQGGERTVSLEGADAPGSARRLTTTGGQATPPPSERATLRPAAPLRRRTLAAAGAAIAVAAAAASAGYVLLSRPWAAPSGAEAAPPEAPGDAARLAAAPEPSLEAPAATALTGAMVALEVRHVSLAVAPADALVEVDGAPAEVKDGAVTVSGMPGSRHRVRIAKGGNEVERDVFVTEAGAVPPALELSVTRRAAVPAVKPHGRPPAADAPDQEPTAADAPDQEPTAADAPAPKRPAPASKQPAPAPKPAPGPENVLMPPVEP